jgi:cohesin complex subunit SCC1
MDNLQHWDIDLFNVGAHDGIESQDFQDIDIGINWDDERHHASRDDISSLEIGRDASPRASINSFIEGRVAQPVSFLSGRSPDHTSADLQHGDVEVPTFEGVDLVEFGVGFDHQGSQTNERGLSRACA